MYVKIYVCVYVYIYIHVASVALESHDDVSRFPSPGYATCEMLS